MSQQPSRPPGGGYGPQGWSPHPTSPSPFRPASPFNQPQSPHQSQGRSRGTTTPVHHPISPLTYSHPHQVIHPMSPVPIGMPISPGMSPVFGCPPPGFIQCPRPRWPSPITPSNITPRPYIPQVMHFFFLFFLIISNVFMYHLI